MNIERIAVYQALGQVFSNMLNRLVTSNLSISGLFIVYFRMLCFDKNPADVSHV